jgi:hypothetical protein
VKLLTVSLYVSPAEDVVADVNVLGRHFTHERVLSSTSIAIASDGVSIEGHGTPCATFRQRHRVLRPKMDFSTRPMCCCGPSNRSKHGRPPGPPEGHTEPCLAAGTVVAADPSSGTETRARTTAVAIVTAAHIGTSGVLAGASLPGTLASPRTGLAPAGCPQLVAWLRHHNMNLLVVMAPKLLDALPNRRVSGGYRLGLTGTLRRPTGAVSDRSTFPSGLFRRQDSCK